MHNKEVGKKMFQNRSPWFCSIEFQQSQPIPNPDPDLFQLRMSQTLCICEVPPLGLAQQYRNNIAIHVHFFSENNESLRLYCQHFTGIDTYMTQEALATLSKRFRSLFLTSADQYTPTRTFVEIFQLGHNVLNLFWLEDLNFSCAKFGRKISTERLKLNKKRL